MTETPSTRPRSDVRNVLVVPPLLFGVALAVGFLMQWIAPRPIMPSNARYWIGGVLLVFGAFLATWGSRVMEQAGTNVNPTLPSLSLVATGPFLFSRNPLYVSLTLMYVGLALLANALWVLVLIAPVLILLHYGVVRREERYLEAKFGDAYRAYRSRVRRYL
jgi:protein-S-isoprenylcysteine O-methyltransferase Ste14